MSPASMSLPASVTVIEAASSAPLPTAPPVATGASLTALTAIVAVAAAVATRPWLSVTV